MPYRSLAACLAFLTLALPLTARIGESRGGVEQRLLSDRRALPIPNEEVDTRLRRYFPEYKRMLNVVSYEYIKSESHSSEMQAFLTQMTQELKYIKGKLSYALYYKPYDKDQASRSDFQSGTPPQESGKPGKMQTPNGWLYFVVYADNVSVFEGYKKIGAAIIQKEKDYLLSVNMGSSTWKEDNLEEGEEPIESFFGQDVVRVDGKVRANIGGNADVIIFDAGFDNKLAEKQKYLESSVERLAEENLNTSVIGF